MFLQSVFQKQGLNISTEQIEQMSSLVTPKTLKQVSDHFTKPVELSKPAQLPDLSSLNLEQATTLLNDPSMSQAASSLLAPQFGRKPEEIQTAFSVLGKCLALATAFSRAKRFLVSGSHKYFTLAGLVLFAAHYLGHI